MARLDADAAKCREMPQNAEKASGVIAEFLEEGETAPAIALAIHAVKRCFPIWPERSEQTEGV
ncbi:MAG: hypothetical protein GVY16_11195 [Planctomycetes bacterium]|jgi:hypothetical protein|nr:hypothetical protein [Phycisphaerae bacterium]NBB96289.1 hypothetical protein [Planctomycetota bacterium]